MAFSNNPILRYTHGRTFYHFWVTNDNKAEFEFCNEATPFAIDQPQTHIIPACTPRNTRENYTTGIKTLKKGTAHLEDDKWVVDQKAEIEYLY